MKTHNQNNATRSKLTPSNEGSGDDTNKLQKFEVILTWTQHNHATTIIEAVSLEQAEEVADAIQSEDIVKWKPMYGELYVHSVEPVEGGKEND